MVSFFKIINYWVFVLQPSISSLLQSATAYFTTKSDGVLLQSVISVITKCDRCYKVRQFYYKVRRLLQSATEHTYTLSTVYIEPKSIPHRPHIYPLPFLTAQLHLSGVPSLDAKHPACIYSASLFARTGARATSCFRMFTYRSFS